VLDFFGDIGSLIMTPLYYVISAILLGFHKVFGNLFGAESGIAWVLSIIGLTLVIRAALIPLFVKQIKSSRNMQLIQPKVRELQKKYGHDREKLAQETMKLYKEAGTNPFASCLPILLQMPIFLALFRLIDQAAKKPATERGLMTETLNRQFGDAVFAGGKISDTFLNAEGIEVRILAAFLVLAMTATTFLTQRQLMSKNMPADALSGPYAQQQKMLLYVLPVVFAVGGIAFPVGVLFYWTTSNLWTMGQQFYVIRNNPAPGTPAAAAKLERDRAKAAKKGIVLPEDLEAQRLAEEAEARREEQKRVQPKRQPRSQRSGGQKPNPQKAGPKQAQRNKPKPKKR
jgi:YidC/Oxa1 family membrane protein insertase